MTASNFPVIRHAGGARYEIDTDQARLDLALIHGFLSGSHWAKGIPLPVLERAIAHSRCFGLYRDGAQIGFARVVTDHATFAYLADVFVQGNFCVSRSARSRGMGRSRIGTLAATSVIAGTG